MEDRAPIPFSSNLELRGYNMWFVVGLHRTKKGHNAIWVVVDGLTKSAHFILVKMTMIMDKLVQLLIDILWEFMVHLYT